MRRYHRQLHRRGPGCKLDRISTGFIIAQRHVSVRRNSLYNSMPWTIWGGPIAFGGFGVGYKEKYRLWGVQPKHSHSYVLDWGGPIAFGAFCAIPTFNGIPSLRA